MTRLFVPLLYVLRGSLQWFTSQTRRQSHLFPFLSVLFGVLKWAPVVFMYVTNIHLHPHVCPHKVTLDGVYCGLLVFGLEVQRAWESMSQCDCRDLKTWRPFWVADDWVKSDTLHGYGAETKTLKLILALKMWLFCVQLKKLSVSPWK